MHSWTKKQKTQVFRLAKAGTPYSEIAKQFEVSVGAIAAQVSLAKQEKERQKSSRLRKKVNQLRKAGAAIDLSTIRVDKVVDGKWKKKHRALAYRLWKKGAKYQDIANLLGVTMGAVSGQVYLLKNGEKKKTKVERPKKVKPEPVDVDQTIQGSIFSESVEKPKRGRPRKFSLDIQEKPKRGRPKKIDESPIAQKKRGRPAKASSPNEVKVEHLKPSVDKVILDNSIPWKSIPGDVKLDIKRNLKLLSKIEKRLADPKKKFGKVTARHILKFKANDDRLREKLLFLFPPTEVFTVAGSLANKGFEEMLNKEKTSVNPSKGSNYDILDQILDELRKLAAVIAKK